jgi:hypothetical protein
MEYSEYFEVKRDVENYFANIIKSRFKKYVDENFEFDIRVDYLTHKQIEELLEDDGFEVYGMNANMDEFKLLLDFGMPYMQSDTLPFTRVNITLQNDGNYSVYLGKSSFDDDWDVEFEDHYRRYLKMTKEDLQRAIKLIKDTHLMLMLKKGY